MAARWGEYTPSFTFTEPLPDLCLGPRRHPPPPKPSRIAGGSPPATPGKWPSASPQTLASAIQRVLPLKEHRALHPPLDETRTDTDDSEFTREAPRRFPSRASLTQRPGECIKSLSRQCPAVPSLTKVLGLASPGCLSWSIPALRSPVSLPPKPASFQPTGLEPLPGAERAARGAYRRPRRWRRRRGGSLGRGQVAPGRAALAVPAAVGPVVSAARAGAAEDQRRECERAGERALRARGRVRGRRAPRAGGDRSAMARSGPGAGRRRKRREVRSRV